MYNGVFFVFLHSLSGWYQPPNTHGMTTLHQRISQTLRLLVATAMLWLPCLHAVAQTEVNGLHVKEYSWERYSFDLSVKAVQSTTIDGHTLLLAEGLSTDNVREGQPLLPMLTRLVVLPHGAVPIIDILVDDTTTILSLDSVPPIARSVGPQFKAPRLFAPAASDIAPPTENESVVTFEILGTMRGMRLARLTVRPFHYNPENNTVIVHRKLSATIHFTHADRQQTTDMRQRYASPFFVGQMPNLDDKAYTNTLIADSIPPRYLIVSPSQYRNTLQPFIAWKRQCGFHVDILYTHTPDHDSIKAMMATYFDSSTAANPAPSFILLVGDMQQIYPFYGQHTIPGLNSHVTDLYFAEYTGDYLPDAMIGRLPVADSSELRGVIEKTLMYEQYRLPDPNYLNRFLLVAGKESTPPAPTATNGMVDYLKRSIAHARPSADTLCFYSPSSDELRDSILHLWREGVGCICYSGHGRYRGWQHPTILDYTIDSLPTDGHPSFIVNNCCSSNDLATSCFGSHLLVLPRGGAIGVIGACNETLWNEDYYWSVGAKTVSTTPAYSDTALGAFDRLLHSHGEAPCDHAATQGQILLAGNCAVTQAGSVYDAFYWEIYHLFGDPSLMPYIGVPEPLSITIDDSITPGITQVGLHGTPGASVALTNDTMLLGVCSIDSSGVGRLRLSQPIDDGMVILTATTQFHQPWIDTVIHPIGGIVPCSDAPSCRLYPNPARDRVRLDFGSSRHCTVRIYDSRGRIVDTFSNNSQREMQYSTQKLRLGVFFVVISNADEVSTHRLLILR